MAECHYRRWGLKDVVYGIRPVRLAEAASVRMASKSAC